MMSIRLGVFWCCFAAAILFARPAEGAFRTLRIDIETAEDTAPAFVCVRARPTCTALGDLEQTFPPDPENVERITKVWGSNHVCDADGKEGRAVACAPNSVSFGVSDRRLVVVDLIAVGPHNYEQLQIEQITLVGRQLDLSFAEEIVDPRRIAASVDKDASDYEPLEGQRTFQGNGVVHVRIEPRARRHGIEYPKGIDPQRWTLEIETDANTWSTPKGCLGRAETFPRSDQICLQPGVAPPRVKLTPVPRGEPTRDRRAVVFKLERNEGTTILRATSESIELAALRSFDVPKCRGSGNEPEARAGASTGNVDDSSADLLIEGVPCDEIEGRPDSYTCQVPNHPPPYEFTQWLQVDATIDPVELGGVLSRFDDKLVLSPKDGGLFTLFVEGNWRAKRRWSKVRHFYDTAACDLALAGGVAIQSVECGDSRAVLDLIERLAKQAEDRSREISPSRRKSLRHMRARLDAHYRAATARYGTGKGYMERRWHRVVDLYYDALCLSEGQELPCSRARSQLSRTDVHARIEELERITRAQKALASASNAPTSSSKMEPGDVRWLEEALNRLEDAVRDADALSARESAGAAYLYVTDGDGRWRSSALESTSLRHGQRVWVQLPALKCGDPIAYRYEHALPMFREFSQESTRIDKHAPTAKIQSPRDTARKVFIPLDIGWSMFTPGQFALGAATAGVGGGAELLWWPSFARNRLIEYAFAARMDVTGIRKDYLIDPSIGGRERAGSPAWHVWIRPEAMALFFLRRGARWLTLGVGGGYVFVRPVALRNTEVYGAGQHTFSVFLEGRILAAPAGRAAIRLRYQREPVATIRIPETPLGEFPGSVERVDVFALDLRVRFDPLELPFLGEQFRRFARTGDWTR